MSCLSVTNWSSQDILLQLFFICQKSVLHKFFLINLFISQGVQMKRFAFDDFFHFTETVFKYFYLSFLFIYSLKPSNVSDMSVLCFHWSKSNSPLFEVLAGCNGRVNKWRGRESRIIINDSYQLLYICVDCFESFFFFF